MSNGTGREYPLSDEALFEAFCRFLGADGLRGQNLRGRSHGAVPEHPPPEIAFLSRLRSGAAALGDEDLELARFHWVAEYVAGVKGMEHLSTGNFALAVAYFEWAIERSADDDRAWFGLGLARFRTGDYRGAEAAFTRCVDAPAAGRGISSAYARRYMARINLGDRAGAWSDYQLAVRDPGVKEYFRYRHRQGSGQALILMAAYPRRAREIVAALRRSDAAA